MNSRPKGLPTFVPFFMIILVLAVVGNKVDKTDDEEVPFNEAK